MKTAEEIYYQCIDVNDNALDRHRHILEAMEQYRTEGLRDELIKFMDFQMWCSTKTSMLTDDEFIDEYLKQKGLPL